MNTPSLATIPHGSRSTVQRFNDSTISLSLRSLAAISLFLSVLTFAPLTVRANVYATNIRLNGGFTNVVATAVTNVAISYILNEPATLGVSININSGATTVRTITLTNPSSGTLQGSNYVVWDGLNNSSNTVAGGIYSVSITAASSGYTNWTETSSELDDFDYRVFWPRGIAVNRNTNSPYYGRVFVANASQGFDTTTYPGDRIGITLHNADGSYADEGGYSTGGYDWANGNDPISDEFSPWKLEVGSDDRLYANDFYKQGVILSFDQLVSTNSLLPVLGTSNYPTSDVDLDGPFISSSGGTLQIWMADDSAGAGVVRWNLTGGIVASNDTGITIIQPNSPTGLDLVPQDIALDSSNNIYVIQDSEKGSDWRVLRFPAYTNVTETNASWRIGSGDDSMRGAAGVAVDSTGTYVAVAFKGFFDGNYEDGSLQVFAASNGAPIITLAPGDDHHDTAWDNVGNLYAVDGFASRWRSYSPPGTNQATTVAVPTVRIGVATAPVLSNASYVGAAGQFIFTLTGEANATYTILSSTDLSSWTTVGTSTSASAVRQITNNVSGTRAFFRARLGP